MRRQQQWRVKGYTQYDLPLRLNSRATSALFLGAGSGNDPAAAVRAGVPNVTAVDIDPITIEFGRRYHPEQPYAHKSVSSEVAAFLLLEVSSISRAALVLGTAWQPTAAIITGILIMALASNALTSRKSAPAPVVSVIGALGSCFFLYFFDFSQLLALPVQARFLATAC